jgi:2-polyprenyl-6-methoxyphenol hydroxylase-like FAD-dependent oxidoreductase
MLAERLGEYGGLIGELARSLPDSSDIVYSPLEPLLMPAPWHRGRVVLVGDAAHATTPHIAQGASMAFEDAVVLSELLGEAPSIDQALQAYTARRWERCRLIVHNSLQIGRWQLQAWEGKPDPQADIVTLSNQTLEALRAPI